MARAGRTNMQHNRLLTLKASVCMLASVLIFPIETRAAHKNDFANKVVVITGASSGFGKGVATKLAGKGAHVVLAARRVELLNQVAQSAGGDALVVPTDVADAAAVQKLADAAVARYGHIDVWINNAGVGAIGNFENIPVADHSRLIDINLKGVIYGSHSALRQFRSQGYGTLVNVGSIDSEVPLAYQASYSASKAGVLGLGRALNEEIRLSGMKKRIKVATVMPWAADTPWWPHAANYSGGTPRMGFMDGPEKVVNGIIKACAHPKEECPIGWKANLSYRSHKLMPDLTERLSANAVHHYQITTAPPAPPTDGTLFQPMLSGAGISGGVRERMKLEDEARKNGQQSAAAAPDGQL